MADPFAAGKLNQPIRRTLGFQLDDRCAQFFGHREILFELPGVLWINPRRLLLWSFYVYGIPNGGKPSGNARAGAQQSLGRAA